MIAEWLSYDAIRKRLGVGKHEIDTLTQVGILRIRFEGTTKGIVIRYCQPDVECIAREHGTRERLRAEVEELKADWRKWEIDRQHRLAADRQQRQFREDERRRAEDIAAEFNRLFETATRSRKIRRASLEAAAG